MKFPFRFTITFLFLITFQAVTIFLFNIIPNRDYYNTGTFLKVVEMIVLSILISSICYYFLRNRPFLEIQNQEIFWVNLLGKTRSRSLTTITDISLKNLAFCKILILNGSTKNLILFFGNTEDFEKLNAYLTKRI